MYFCGRLKLSVGCVYVHIGRERDCMVYFKELAHPVVEAGKSKICRLGITQGRDDVETGVQGQSGGRILPPGRSVFFSIKAFN